MTHPQALTRTSLFLVAAVLGSSAPDLRAQVSGDAWRHARESASAVVVVDYVLEKEGEGFGSVNQRAELAAVGVVASADGLLVTSDNIFPEDEDEFRVPARPHSFRVRLSEEETRPAQLLGRDGDVGLAFLQLELPPGRELPHLEFVDRPLDLGETVLVASLLPEKYGFAPALGAARVAAIVDGQGGRRYDLDGLLQDTSVGAPVFDADGQAVGLITTDRFENGDGGPLAFPLKVIGAVTRGKAAGFPLVVPTGSFSDLLADPPRTASVAAAEKAWLGVTLQPVEPKLAEYLGLAAPTGVMVTSVWGGSPAEKAGLRPEDIIVRFDGRDINCPDDAALLGFIQLVQGSGVGNEVKVELRRDGRLRTKPVRLGTAPKTSVRADEYRSEAFGLAAQDLTVDIIQSRGWPADMRGALVTDIETAGWAQVGGLQRGDLILAVDDGEVRDVQDLKRLLVEAETAEVAELVLFVLRDPDTLFVVLTPGR